MKDPFAVDELNPDQQRQDEEADGLDPQSVAFDRLLDGANLDDVLAGIGDAHVREAVRRLWENHIAATKEDFLEQSIQIAYEPALQPGDVLLERFAVEKMLGSGGMGEVYLAFDRKVGERVAIKTISPLLLSSEAARSQFSSEVLSARRVSHRNVCRIHELFEDGEMVFLSMEYVEGQALGELISKGVAAPLAAELCAQIAEGLQAAHQSGVVHGDLKPANILVCEGAPPRAVIMDFGLARVLREQDALPEAVAVAGTVGYMAPELAAGRGPSIASDIYAFGKVARQLQPQTKRWLAYTAEKPERRPKSLTAAIGHLRGRTRRYWTGGLLAAGAVATGSGLWLTSQPQASLPAGARLLVNGFRSAMNESGIARLARSLVVAALRQSPRISAVADQDLLPALRRLKPEANLPVEGDALRQLLATHRASFWADGELRQTGARYSLTLRLLRSSDGLMLREASFRDLPGVVPLAGRAAEWVREQAGESRQSLAVNPSLASAITSSVPEALAKYYAGMDQYSVGNMPQAIPLLEEATHIDSGFAQAHSMLGMCLNSQRRYVDAFQHVEQAVQLGTRLPERERTWMESNYALLVEDSQAMVAAARRNVGYYPDEQRFHRILGQILCRTGSAGDAIAPLRKAVELAPEDDLIRNELIVALCEAGEPAEGHAEYLRAVGKPEFNRFLHRGGGLALLGLGRYSEAVETLGSMPGRSKRLVAGAKVLAGDFDAALASLQEEAARTRVELNLSEEMLAREFLCGTYVLLGREREAWPHVEAMGAAPAYPPFAKHLESAAFWAARCRHADALEKLNRLLEEIAAKWPNGHTRAAALHARVLGDLGRGQDGQAEAMLLEATGSAFSVWALFDLADFYTQRGKAAVAEEHWRRFESHHGTVLKLWFPGLVLLGWHRRAEAARLRGDCAVAAACAGKVLRHWPREHGQARMAQAARQIQDACKSYRGEKA